MYKTTHKFHKELQKETANDEEKKERRNIYKTRELEVQHGNKLQAKMEELAKIKEELKRAKDRATQSWLDSRPLIDELEKLQSGLASAKNQTSMSNIVITELESQLEVTNECIKSKAEEEVKATKMINEMTLALDQLRDELETIKRETDEECRARLKLKQELRMKRQSLRTLQLKFRAIRIESAAFGASAAEALRHINTSETDNSTVRLTQDEYHALQRRAKEETSLAEWRISVSMEQKLAAEASRDLAASRLKELDSESRTSKWTRKVEKIVEEAEDEEEDLGMREEADQLNRGSAFPKARAEAIAKSNRRKLQQNRRSGKTSKKKLFKKKKPSILRQIRRCIIRSIKKLFG